LHFLSGSYPDNRISIEPRAPIAACSKNRRVRWLSDQHHHRPAGMNSAENLARSAYRFVFIIRFFIHLKIFAPCANRQRDKAGLSGIYSKRRRCIRSQPHPPFFFLIMISEKNFVVCKKNHRLRYHYGIT